MLKSFKPVPRVNDNNNNNNIRYIDGLGRGIFAENLTAQT